MEILSRNHFMLKISGLLYENIICRRYRAVTVTVYVFAFSFTLIPQFTYAIVNKDNVTKTTAALSLFFSSLLTLFKVLFYCINMKKIYLLRIKIQKNMTKRIESGYRQIFIDAEKEVKIVSNLFNASLLSCIVFSIMEPIIKMINHNPKDHLNNGSELTLPLSTEYFFDTTTHPTYDIVYVLCSLSTSCIVLLLCTMDCLFVGLVVYVRAHFIDVQLLIKNLDNIYDKDFKKISTKKLQHCNEVTNQFYENVKWCAVYHNEVLSYFDIIQKTMNLTIFMQYICGTVLLCFIIFQTSLSMGNEDLPLYTSFLSGCVSQLLMYSWYGTSLTYEGLKVADAAYNCCWYKFPIKSQILILNIMRRAQRPAVLSGLQLFDCSLSTFMSIYKTSTSALALLQNMAD